MSDRLAEGTRRPKTLYVVVEKMTDGTGLGHVDISRVMVDREEAEREKSLIADAYREMAEEGEGWEKWSVEVRELRTHDDLADAEPISEKEHELVSDAADAVAESMLGGIDS